MPTGKPQIPGPHEVMPRRSQSQSGVSVQWDMYDAALLGPEHGAYSIQFSSLFRVATALLLRISWIVNVLNLSQQP